MENASKALIIAGAILLSILIISLGIMIFSQASEVVDSNAMSELEVTQFNAKFQSYMGTAVRGSQVNSLINQVMQHNLANQDDNSRQVAIELKSCTANTNWTGAIPSTATKITARSQCGSAMTGKTYNVDYETNSNNGLITQITITGKD